MLNAISQKIQTAYALLVVFMLCRLDDRKKKLHINYSVRGVATIAAVDKFELSDESELYYIDPQTAMITKRFDQGYYQKSGMIMNVDSNWEVDLDSFRAKVPSQINPDEIITLNREEFATHCLLPDQARICMPDGTELIVTRSQANSFIARELTMEDLKATPRQQLRQIITKFQGNDNDGLLPIVATSH